MAREREIDNQKNIMKIEAMIKKYNKKPDKDIKKKDIVKILKTTEIIVPVYIDYEEMTLLNEQLLGTVLKPDIVKDNHRARLLPVFTTYEQIPRDYMDNFSLIRMSAMDAYGYMNTCEDIHGMVINPFTDLNLELRKKVDKSSTRSIENVIDEIPRAIIIYNNNRYEIDSFPFTIGRDGTNIEIPEAYISKIHVVISYKDGRFRIADYDSTNGTKINGKEIKPKVYYELKDGFEIELADEEKMLVYIG